jgi:hypothetical protein
MAAEFNSKFKYTILLSRKFGVDWWRQTESRIGLVVVAAI